MNNCRVEPVVYIYQHSTHSLWQLNSSLNFQSLLQPLSLPTSLSPFSLPVTLPHMSHIFMPSFLHLSSSLWAWKITQSSQSLLLSFPPDSSKSNELLLYLSSYSSMATLSILFGIYLWCGSTYYILSVDIAVPPHFPNSWHTHQKNLSFYRAETVFSNFIFPVLGSVHWVIYITVT